MTTTVAPSATAFGAADVALAIMSWSVMGRCCACCASAASPMRSRVMEAIMILRMAFPLLLDSRCGPQRSGVAARPGGQAERVPHPILAPPRDAGGFQFIV